METWEVFGTFLMHEKAKLVASDEFTQRPLQEQIEGWTLAVGISCYLNSSDRGIELSLHMLHVLLIRISEGENADEKAAFLGAYLKRMHDYLPIAQDESRPTFERYQAMLKCFIARLAHCIVHQTALSDQDKEMLGTLAFNYVLEEAIALISKE